MVIDIKMCRFDNVPWGFRLVGGSDFEFPLTVVKVTEGSIAEEAGLQAGDVIVRVNDTATSPLTHEEANQIIRHCGNVFFLGVCRENEDTMMDDKQQFPIMGNGNRTTPDSFLDVGSSSCKSPISRTYSEERDYLPDLRDRPCSVLSENTERKIIEEEITSALSNESEVLKEHNVVGIFPKPGVCMSSDVLRTLNDEVTRTKTERDKEKRKWTTFLQKPNRPIPKSRAQIEAEKHAANAYKVRIVKSKPKSPTVDVVVPIIVEPISMPEELKIQEKENEILDVKPPIEEEIKPTDDSIVIEQEIRNEAPSPTDSEVPSLDDIPEEKRQSIVSIETVNTEIEVKITSPTKSLEEKPLEQETTEQPEPSEITTIIDTIKSIESKEENISKSAIIIKTEEELALERQLADVQRQLVALSSLPSTIQSTLDAVTKQLAEMLPAFKLQQAQKASDNEVRDVQLEQSKENNTETIELNGHENSIQEGSSEQNCEKNGNASEEEKKTIDEQPLNGECENEICDDSNAIEKQSNNKPIEGFTEAIQEQAKQLKPVEIMTEEQSLKKQKKHEVIEELEEHLDRKRNPKRSKRAFGPLTPSSERPLVLPGGRRWYRPKDAFNDEFIAEVLSSQAELITGTTLGSNFESLHTGYDPRVNFMKYQKPEKKVDLDRSEVYKVIHHLDRQPVRGIEIRASKVAAEADIRRAVQS